ncbi:MAG: ATP--guanido phosphotransferase, partial [Opitutae bacterium]|nr:ATP--guanido phosphotransferase [Opitutae bacterium]
QDDRTRLIDKMSRAIGSLKTCHLIQSAEAMDLLSLVRLATDFGMMPEKFRGLADRMFIEVQPGHVQLSAGKAIDPSRRDELRAELLRNHFLRAPLLDLSSH